MNSIEHNDGKKIFSRNVQSRRRVLIYAMNYSPEVTGCGKYTGEIGQHLKEHGIDVEVVTTQPHYPGWSIRKDLKNRYTVEKQAGVTIWRCPLWLFKQAKGVRRLAPPLSFAISSAPIVIWRVLFRRPNIIYCVEPTLLAAPAALLAAKLMGVRTVLHVQDLEVDAAFAVGHVIDNTWARYIAGLFERICVKAFDHVVTISETMAEHLRRKGVNEGALTLVRNWVDLEHIQPVNRSKAYRAEIGIAEDAFVALYSGNLGRKQGLELIVDAARLLKDEHRIAFVIAGEGPEKESLQSRAVGLPNVHFIPLQPWERFGEFLGLCDVHLLPQQANTSGIVLPSKVAGMLASGRRIVAAADRGSELEHFLRDAAIVVVPGDAEAFAAAISAELKNSIEYNEPGVRLARALSAVTALGSILDLILLS